MYPVHTSRTLSNSKRVFRPICRGTDLGAPLVLCLLISTVGLGIAATVLSMIIPEQRQNQADKFYTVADEAFIRFETSIDDYRVSGLWVHQACLNRQMSFLKFREVYEYIISTGLDFQAISCGRNVSSSERSSYEAQSRRFLAQNYPEFDYVGFTSVELNRTTNIPEHGPASSKSFYYVTHLVEPLEDPFNKRAIDFDISTSPSHGDIARQALETGLISVTERLEYLPHPQDPVQPYEYSLIIAHPGLPVQDVPFKASEQSKDTAIMVVRFAALLEKAFRDVSVVENTVILVYDTTVQAGYSGGREPEFLGGVQLGDKQVTNIHEVNYSTLQSAEHALRKDTTLNFAARQWSFVVLASPNAYQPQYFLVILGASMIVLASACAALWIFTRLRARAEKAAILLGAAKKAAQAERELNDFIAHEVRNPLSAAISANKFVSLALTDNVIASSPDSIQSIREDVLVVGNSLRYINDLLRSMLDFHCALTKQMKLQFRPVDVRHDIFAPVASMLYHRGCDYDVLIDCSEDIVVMSDPLRLKQVILNLAINATKFVMKGFVRLRSQVVSGQVYLYVEDSGPGIPVHKRDHLFSKFQSSLDSLNQGTGIGLSLCKLLIEMMNGDIRLDLAYSSGIEGYPGTRFIVQLNAAPLRFESSHFCNDEKDTMHSNADIAPIVSETSDSQETTAEAEFTSPVHLPENLSVLFVDDDFILRKLFIRSVRRCRPKWDISEAASGEAALQLVADRKGANAFDIIFLDHYMASTEKQLLGTETVRLLRSRGVQAVICGLSANNMAHQFVQAGADCFSMKPFPCENNELVRELSRILCSRQNH